MSFYNDTVPLSRAVKAATIDLGEDLTRVEATFNHFALRGLEKINIESLRNIGLAREIVPIHTAFKTATLPLGTKKVVFVGVIDDCGYKHPLTQKSQITIPLDEPVCKEKCPKCDQDKDICELLQVEETKTPVTVAGVAHFNTITKYLENGRYYQVKKTWVLNTTTNFAEEVTTKEIITEFDMLSCGCVAPTGENVAKVKEHCYSCYCACYTPCMEDEYDLGGYRVFEEQNLIQFDKSIDYQSVYVEYYTDIPKKGGVYHIPAVAFETLVAYIKYKHTFNKRNIGFSEKEMYRKEYRNEKENLDIVTSRVKMSGLIRSFSLTPKVGSSGGSSVCSGGRYRNTVPITSTGATTAAAIAQPTITFPLYSYTSQPFNIVNDNVDTFQTSILIDGTDLSFVILDKQILNVAQDFTVNYMTGVITFINGVKLFSGSTLTLSFNKKN